MQALAGPSANWVWRPAALQTTDQERRPFRLATRGGEKDPAWTHQLFTQLSHGSVGAGAACGGQRTGTRGIPAAHAAACHRCAGQLRHLSAALLQRRRQDLPVLHR